MFQLGEENRREPTDVVPPVKVRGAVRVHLAALFLSGLVTTLVLIAPSVASALPDYTSLTPPSAPAATGYSYSSQSTSNSCPSWQADDFPSQWILPEVYDCHTSTDPKAFSADPSSHELAYNGTYASTYSLPSNLEATSWTLDWLAGFRESGSEDFSQLSVNSGDLVVDSLNPTWPSEYPGYPAACETSCESYLAHDSYTATSPITNWSLGDYCSFSDGPTNCKFLEWYLTGDHEAKSYPVIEPYELSMTLKESSPEETVLGSSGPFLNGSG